MTIWDYLLSLGTALTVTCLLEGAVICCFPPRFTWFRFSLIANVVTNPAVNLVLWGVLAIFPEIDGVYWCCFVLLELLVVAVEGWIYLRCTEESWRRCILASLLANAVSCGAGWILF